MRKGVSSLKAKKAIESRSDGIRIGYQTVAVVGVWDFFGMCQRRKEGLSYGGGGIDGANFRSELRKGFYFQ